MEEKKKLSPVEREKLRFERLQQEMINSKKKIEEAKNKEVLKVWRKIKPLFLEDEIIEKIQEPEFIEKISIEIQQILKKYISVVKEGQQEIKSFPVIKKEEEKKEDKIDG